MIGKARHPLFSGKRNVDFHFMRQRFENFLARCRDEQKRTRCASKFSQLIADEYKSDKVIDYWTKNPEKMAEVQGWFEKLYQGGSC